MGSSRRMYSTLLRLLARVVICLSAAAFVWLSAGARLAEAAEVLEDDERQEMLLRGPSVAHRSRRAPARPGFPVSAARPRADHSSGPAGAPRLVLAPKTGKVRTHLLCSRIQT